MEGNDLPDRAPRYVGARVLRAEDPRFLRGAGRFVDDLQIPGMCHLAFVRSPHAHARIRKIDVEEAAALPGVIRVWTGQEARRMIPPMYGDALAPGFKKAGIPVLAHDKVRFVGEPVAVAVAESRYLAEDAASLVHVEYEPLRAIIDPEKALAETEIRVHEEWNDNIYWQKHFSSGDVAAAFRQAHRIVRGRYCSQRYTAVPMEGRGYVAHYDVGRDELTLWASSQTPHIERTLVADLIGLPENKFRVVAPDVGGGFGLKCLVFPEEVVIAYLAWKLRRPLKWIEDRREHLLASMHAREHIHELEAAVDQDGRILALRSKILVDAGAYSSHPWTSVMEMGMAQGVLPGPYRIECYESQAITVATNKCPIGPYRGVARPAACFSMERLMDDIAEALRLDPVEIRLRNYVQSEDFPYTSVTGLVYDSGSYVESMHKLVENLNYGAFRREQADARRANRLLGVGLACYTEQTAHGVVEWAKRGVMIVPGYESAAVRVEPSGHVTVMLGTASHGQGHETAMAQIAAEELGVEVGRVRVLHGDTDISPYGMGTYASRSAVLAGGATMLAARDIRGKMTRIAADQFEVSVEDIEYAEGSFFVKGTQDRRIRFEEIARLAYHRPEKLPDGLSPGLEVIRRYGAEPGTGTFANAVHAAVVEVDPETGMVHLLRYLTVEDCGRQINPMIVEGQVHGGVVQGIGGALWEELVYDENGQMLTSTFMDYLLPGAYELPWIETDHLETPSPFTLGGFKGMGEGGAIAPGAAIANAVTDALRPLGIRVNELPLSPNKLFEMLRNAEWQQS